MSQKVNPTQKVRSISSALADDPITRRKTAAPYLDAHPDIEERARRMADLVAAEAQPVVDLCLELDLPVSTMDALLAQGRGPKVFKLGRRRYVHKKHKQEWLLRLADTEAQ